jgi:hypothetical protein
MTSATNKRSLKGTERTYKLFPVDVNELSSTVSFVIFPTTNVLVANVGPRVGALLGNEKKKSGQKWVCVWGGGQEECG